MLSAEKVMKRRKAHSSNLVQNNESKLLVGEISSMLVCRAKNELVTAAEGEGLICIRDLLTFKIKSIIHDPHEGFAALMSFWVLTDLL